MLNSVYDAGNFPVLDSIPMKWSEQLILESTVLDYKRNQTIVHEGDISSEVYFVISGTLQVSLTAPNAKESILRDLKAGQMFGELSAIDGGSRSATITTLRNSRLARINAIKFNEFLRSTPDFSVWLNQQYIAIIRDLTRKNLDLVAISVAGRILRELLRMCEETGQKGDRVIINPFPTHEVLAARVGTHREAVTRELKNLASDKVLLQTGRKLEVFSQEKIKKHLIRTLGILT